MTTTRFVSPSLPRRVLSRLSFAVYERIFSYLPFADILTWLPSFSDIIFTYICLYLFFFFFILHCPSFLRSFKFDVSIYLFIFFFFFSSFFFTNSVRIPEESIRFKFRFRNHRSRIRASVRTISFLIIFLSSVVRLFFFPFFLFPEEFDTRSLIDQARTTRFFDVKFTCSTRVGAVLEAWPSKVASEQLSSNLETSYFLDDTVDFEFEEQKR